MLEAEEAEHDPRRNILTSAMTAGGGYTLQTGRAATAAGDRILLTTDGLHTKVSRPAMLALSSTSRRVGDFVAGLRLLAEAKGTDDNYSAIAVDIM